LAVTALLGLATLNLGAATITVDDDGSADFNNIQAAINIANDGDTIVVFDGLYRGEGNRNIDAGDPHAGVTGLVVRSANGPQDCIINGEGASYGFYLDGITYSHNLPISLLEGFTITNCECAIYLHQTGDMPNIRDCIIARNTDNWCAGIGCLEWCTMEITNCIIKDNNGPGVVCTMTARPTISNCVISGNRAITGGGVYMAYQCEPYILSCTVVGNRADSGGAFYVSEESRAEIINCTISENRALNYGGGIFQAGNSDVTIRNSILWADTASDGQEIYQHSGPAPPEPAGTLLVEYSVVQGGWTGEQNLDVDPNFVRQGYWEGDSWVGGDYHLRWHSTCINSGDPSYFALGDKDIDGEPRRIPPGPSPVTLVDRGSDEVGPKQADFTRDGVIALDDLAVFSKAWLTVETDENWYILCDLLEDGQIEWTDLAEFVSEWLWEASWHIN
jgi:parallel beta-helix repeat protein